MPKSTDVVKRAAEFCSSAKFERVVDSFAREHAEVFMDAVEAKGGDVEHKHEYVSESESVYVMMMNPAHLLHHLLVMRLDFVESEGATTEEFYRECREVINAKVSGFFDEHKYAWFVEHLLASMEYELFFGLIVNEARRLRRK